MRQSCFIFALHEKTGATKSKTCYLFTAQITFVEQTNFRLVILKNTYFKEPFSN